MSARRQSSVGLGSLTPRNGRLGESGRVEHYCRKVVGLAVVLRLAQDDID